VNIGALVGSRLRDYALHDSRACRSSTPI
jgi:hypothetical protein